jgi:hypothetical protein
MSEVKVNKISPRTACGTVTLGDSGDTFTIPSGATITNNGTQTGFGREGSVDWQTGSIKTGTFTAATGEGYFVDTSGGTATVNLPAGAAGSIVAISDYTRTFNSNNCTIAPDGSEKLGGIAADGTLTVNGQSATFVYVDGTEGWINVQETQTSQTGLPPYVAACGGNTTITCGDYKTHIFTGPGTFTVTSAGAPGGSNSVEHLTVAGGAGGGKGSGSGGGGGGGYRTTYPSPATGGTPVSAQAYPITVGASGAGSTTPPAAGSSGGTSTFSTIDSAGGGGGGSESAAGNDGVDGGSGGGGSYHTSSPGGTGNTPPTPVAQGTNGGAGAGGPAPYAGGGGGGATVAGAASGTCGGPGGTGGPIADAYFGPTAPSYGTPGPAGSTRYFSGGGGGGAQPPNASATSTGGAGGGGAGGFCSPVVAAIAGTINTGGGGGGDGNNAPGGAGGSGIVVIRYKFQ